MIRRFALALIALVGLAALVVPAPSASAYSRQFMQYAAPSCNSYVAFEAQQHVASVDPVSGCYQVGVRLYFRTSSGVNTSTGWVMRFNGASAVARFSVGTSTKAVFFIWSNWHRTHGGGGIYLTCYPALSSSGACTYGWK